MTKVNENKYGINWNVLEYNHLYNIKEYESQELNIDTCEARNSCFAHVKASTHTSIKNPKYKPQHMGNDIDHGSTFNHSTLYNILPFQVAHELMLLYNVACKCSCPSMLATTALSLNRTINTFRSRTSMARTLGSQTAAHSTNMHSTTNVGPLSRKSFWRPLITQRPMPNKHNQHLTMYTTKVLRRQILYTNFQ